MVKVVGWDEGGDEAWVEGGSPEEVERLAGEGRVVLVVLEGDVSGQVAAASVYGWLGARVFRTAFPEEVRTALDMVESLAGRRPPAVTRRGLA
ncbi:hypothetical protein GCM10009677_34940 [Sphaerisporangium rubeum]